MTDGYGTRVPKVRTVGVEGRPLRTNDLSLPTPAILDVC